MGIRILLVEDEPAVASLIRKTLAEEQYEVSVAMDGDSAWDHISRFAYELLLFDVMVPGINGIELCRRTRAQGIRTPILILTALGSVDNIVMGLDSGADDYLTKPFKIAELLARIRSLLRRREGESVLQGGGNDGGASSGGIAPAGGNEAGGQVHGGAQVQAGAQANGAGTDGAGTNGAPGSKALKGGGGSGDKAAHEPNELVFADIVLDLDQRNMRRNGQVTDLTATEFRLLEYFLRNPRKVLSRMDILEKVWGYDFNMNTKVVDVYINYLRKKLDDPGSGRIIHTVVGMGYMLKEE